MSKQQSIDEFIETLRRHLAAVPACGMAEITVDVNVRTGYLARKKFLFQLGGLVVCTLHVSSEECRQRQDNQQRLIDELQAEIERLKAKHQTWGVELLGKHPED